MPSAMIMGVLRNVLGHLHSLKVSYHCSIHLGMTDWLSNIQRLADCRPNFHTKKACLKHWVQAKLYTTCRRDSSEPASAYQHGSGPISSNQHVLNRPCESCCYGLPNFKLLMANHALFNIHLDHVLAALVHA